MTQAAYVLAAALTFCSATISHADVTWMTGGDLFDVTRGAVITDSSPIASGSNAAALIDVDQPGVEYGALFFPDGSDGTVHYIEWETASPVTLAGFNLWGNADLPDFPEKRTIEHFKLTAEVGDDTVVVYDEDVEVPYEFIEDEFALIVSTPVTPTTASKWRAEFTQHGDGIGSGPRIQELDGFPDRICGDANTSGAITASDALLALKGAVGTEWCVYCICNVDDNDDLTASDALAILRAGVGLPIELECITCFVGAD